MNQDRGFYQENYNHFFIQVMYGARFGEKLVTVLALSTDLFSMETPPPQRNLASATVKPGRYQDFNVLSSNLRLHTSPE